MPVETGIWRVDGGKTRRLVTTGTPTEVLLEEFLERDSNLLGEPLLIIGRQVRTPYGKYIDLLAIDTDANLVVLELKRDRSPRDVVAQTLDYASWVKTLESDDVVEMATEFLKRPLAEAFADTFGIAFPDEVNVDLRMTVVATELDDSSERIVEYLREFGVPINAVFFSFYEDEGRQYLTRSWLVHSDTTPGGASTTSRKQQPWNGIDWYVSFGDDESRAWEDGRRLGFISAGGGNWYSRTLRNLPVGARVNVYLPQRGYVAVGVTLAEAQRFDAAKVESDGGWVRLANQSLIGRYRHGPEGEPDSDELAEYAVPVRWHHTVSAEEALREPGLFASQHSACKLRQQHTLNRIAEHFGLDEEEGVAAAAGEKRR
ncbi:hypothetical protein GCM10027055_26250 [Janibacter alkaliphilus]|uniref:Endonuclease NucS C-terminal domain-containing protein n=1 Tax=Janibacter alkaliphilus TaxID=1069963 RepID=A0A852XHF1_9MICO|nr:endonuclease NucS domain-containing protein [Janibacter alkaliphilus]NYG37965.1 hypothetical protein [Janibacter alkaliphilus]